MEMKKIKHINHRELIEQIQNDENRGLLPKGYTCWVKEILKQMKGGINKNGK